MNLRNNMESLNVKVSNTYSDASRPASDHNFRGLLESKVIGFMKPFTNEIAYYKVWMDKYVNAVAQIR